MSKPALLSPTEANQAIAAVLAAHGSHAAVPRLAVEVHEDRCFGPGEWLGLGEMQLHPNRGREDDLQSSIANALLYGSFEWHLPARDTAIAEAVALLIGSDGAKSVDREKIEDRARRSLDAVVHILVRLGLLNPIFDAAAVSEMPFRRPATIVADTSGVIHGALDFAIRYLFPVARIKIPAIVHMELLNMSDRYFSMRRSGKLNANQKSKCLLDHTTSQGGQRVLLRLELRTDAEIERPRLGADPLRGVVQPDSDQEDKSLKLSSVQRSFADRLILETAVQHRERLSPEHRVMLLTPDQGLARMAIAEGVDPLFFAAPSSEDIFGSIVPATVFRPLVANVRAGLVTTSLCGILWELAATFGSARVRCAETSATVCAIGEGLSWQPFHSKEDLLWFDCQAGRLSADSRSVATIVTEPETGGAARGSPAPETESRQPESPDGEGSEELGRSGSYRLVPASLLLLVRSLAERDSLKDEDAAELLGLQTTRRYLDYKRFLASGGFVSIRPGEVVKAGLLDDLQKAIEDADVESLADLLRRVPSFDTFIQEVSGRRPVRREAISSVAKSAIKGYVSLAEIAAVAIEIPDEGIYSTENRPVLSDFVEAAIDAYSRSREQEEYVLTGRWLEELVRRHRIHPVVGRRRLAEAQAAGLIDRFTEGSTPDTRFEKHRMALLEPSPHGASLETAYLYRGAFLLPGKSSVRIRLRRKSS